MSAQENKSNSVYTIVDIKQRSDEWYRLRNNRVTGSVAHYLKNYPVEYVIAKNCGDGPDGYVSDAMLRGRRLEPIGINRFAEEECLNIDSIGFVLSSIHKDAGFSPDGVIFDKDGTIKTIVEHKAFARPHHFSCYRTVDEKIIYQIQFGMFVTGAEDAYLVLYNPDIYDKDEQLLYRHMKKDNSIQQLFKKRFKQYEEKRL